jgi:UDP-glucose 4-epimerase
MSRYSNYQNKNVLITGGAGFLGSNLAIALVQHGARVTIVDNFLPGHGSNRYNLDPIKDRVHLNIADIRDPISMNQLVPDIDYIFHLAGQVNHIDSLRDPLRDLDINCRGTLVLLEACLKHNRRAVIVFSGTRGQYGPSTRLPVSEDHPMNPKGMYAITNLTAEKMLRVYHEVHGIRSVALRITNTFGPRHQMKHDQYGVVNWFVRRALSRETIDVMGDGRIIRDYLYVDDTVRALLDVGIEPACYGEVYNVGGGEPTSFLQLAKLVVELAGEGTYRFADFSQERKALEPGDYVADITKIGAAVGWRPTISIADGLKNTIDFYRQHGRYYW